MVMMTEVQSYKAALERKLSQYVRDLQAATKLSTWIRIKYSSHFGIKSSRSGDCHVRDESSSSLSSLDDASSEMSGKLSQIAVDIWR